MLRILVLAVFLASCAHKTGSFEVHDNVQVHHESGVEIPKDFVGWTELADSVKEKISPEILASISFEYNTNKMELKPGATIFICREMSTSNLKVVENRVVPGLQAAKLLKTEILKLKNKKRIVLSTYQHQIPWSSTAGSGAKTVRTFKTWSLFATREKDSKTVVWVSFERDTMKDREVAMDFIEKALFVPTKPGDKPLPAPKLKKKKSIN